MAYEPNIDETLYRKVRPRPDDDPVTEWPWGPGTYSYRITAEDIEELISG